jgi:hypothetical protein
VDESLFVLGRTPLELSPFEPLEVLLLLLGVADGTTSVVWAALPLPAMLCSHTSSVQVPGLGTVTVAGPLGGALVGVEHGAGAVSGQIW